MANYYIAPESSFNATADAIRAKTGSQAAIEWTEDGFAEAIEAIPSGGSANFATGTFTPASTVTSATIPIGGVYDHFAIYQESGSNPNTERYIRGAFCDFSKSSAQCVLVASTNNTGGAIAGFYFTSNWFTQDGNNIRYASQSNSTKLLYTQTYRWVAW